MRAGLAATFLSLACQATARDAFTTNAICSKSNCINPIFPALEDLHRLSEATWYCSTLRKAAPSMGFCRAAINYDPAVMAPDTPGDLSTSEWVQRQDSAAATMYVYHLAALGMEAWEHPKPEFSDNDCVKSIWKSVCYTYFPRAQVGCQDGMTSRYLRPCQSSCQNYIKTCRVECCDESVQCVFTHTKALSDATFITTSGYEPHDAPSSLCTGGASRSRGSLVLLCLLQLLWVFDAFDAGGALRSAARQVRRARVRAVWALSLGLLAFLLQGCDVDVPAHTVGNWRGEADYLLTFEFVPPGGSPAQAMLNSCSLPLLSQTVQCSGRGACKRWDDGRTTNPTAFCDCDRDWADPECRTPRKSQLVAYVLSMFLGVFGADHFYLGFVATGVLKGATLGGLGAWWVIDIIRIGSAPVRANGFRVAGDLPHWAFALSTVSFALFLGFAVAYVTVMRNVARRRKEALLLDAEEDLRTRALYMEDAMPKARASATYGSMGAKWPG